MRPQAAYDLIREAIGGASVDTWNNAAGRTQAEVLAAVDRALAIATSRGTP